MTRDQLIENIVYVLFNAMTTEDLQKLDRVFRAVFELPPGTDVARLQQGQHENWDSLGHVKLMAALESEFNVIIDTVDAVNLTSYEVTRRWLEQQGR